jgi:hypothetical protein
VNESSNLGLNSKVQKKFDKVDAVDNVSYIKFEDPEVERICHEHGVYTVDDAANVTSIFDGNEGSIKSGWFRRSNIRSFKEFKYFKGLKEINYFAFTECKELSILNVPENVRIIRQYSLSDCPLKELAIYSRNLELIEYGAINNADKDIYMSKECPAYEKFYNMVKGPRRHPYYEYAKFNIFDLSQYKEAQVTNESRSSSLGLNKHVQKKFDKADAVDNISMYVDLDLPSGTLWKSYNEGQSDLSDTNLGHKFTIDQAKEEFGENLPTRKHYEELIDNCKLSIVNVNGNRMLSFVSKNNSNTLYFPIYCKYWTSTKAYDENWLLTNGCAFMITCSASCIEPKMIAFNGRREFCVRTISKTK